MRGKATRETGTICLINVESQLRSDHPLREVKRMCKEVLVALEPEFARMYATKGRPSIPPERLLMAWILMCLYGVRSCRRFTEELPFNLLYKWFLDMNPDEEGFDSTSFSKNLGRMRTGHVSELFFAEVVELAKSRGWVSNEHFSVDGTLIEAWASAKSFRRKDEPPPPPGQGSNGWVDFKGEKRSNETHASTTDPEAKLVKHSEGDAAKLRYAMHAVSENRNGLLVLLDVKQAVGRALRGARGGERSAGRTDVSRLRREDGGGGQRVSYEGVRAGVPGPCNCAARGACERAQDAVTGRAYRAQYGVQGEPATAQADRGKLRLDEGIRQLSEEPVEGS